MLPDNTSYELINKHPYLTEEERNFITNTCYKLRRSEDSKKNLFYLLTSFSTFMEKPLFEALPMDATNYVNYLLKQMKEGIFQENTCYCIFIELRRFYEFAENCLLISKNPFADIKNRFHSADKICTDSLPSFQEVDTLLDLCQSNTQLYLAVLLAFRMVLSTSEIATLKKAQVCSELGDSNVYLCMERVIDNEKTNVFLLIPDDVIVPLKQTILSTEKDYPYVFRSTGGRPFTIRWLQKQLLNIQKPRGTSIHFSNLRSLGMFLMVVEKAPLDQIAAYAGVEGTWLTLYDHIPEKFKLDTSKYVHLRVCH